MRTWKLLAASFFLILPMSLIAGDTGKIREIDAKDLKVDFEKGSVRKPQTFTSADDFDKAFKDADAIKKQVDFGKEKLLVFAWGGSGGDKLAAKLSDDGKTATFSYTPGLTRDFRRHVHVYAIPKGAEFKIEGGGKGK
jgi:hypothetical protein